MGPGRFVTFLTLVVMLSAVIATAFCFGCVLLIAEAIGSLTSAAFIIAGVFLILMIVLLLCGRRYFQNIVTSGKKEALLAIVRALKARLNTEKTAVG